MIPNPGLQIADAAGKILAAVCAERVIEPERLGHNRHTAAIDSPVSDLVMDLFRPHVVYVLWVISSIFRLAGADKLPRLKDDIPDASLPHPGIFPAGGIDPVHHDAGHCCHADVALAARFTLDEPCQKLSVRIGHRYFTLLLPIAYAAAAAGVPYRLSLCQSAAHDLKRSGNPPLDQQASVPPVPGVPFA